jgi:serine/threonine-protein kinase RsbW
MPVSPGEEALPHRLRTVGTWTLHSVDDLPRMRSSLEARLRSDCPAARAHRRSEEPAALSEAQRIVLVTSELVANGLEHACPPVTVRLLTDGDAAVLDVIDPRPDELPAVPHDRGPGEGGHGLRLAAAVADRVCWFRTADEKHVWAQFGPADLSVGAMPVAAVLGLSR